MKTEAMVENLFIYFFTLAFVLLIWRIKDYLPYTRSDMLKNYSRGSVPLVKTSYNLAFGSPDETFMFPRNCAEKFNKSYRNKFFGIFGLEVCRAEEAEKILGSSKHIDKSILYNLLHPFLNTGLLTSNGEKWHKRRRLLTPAFHFDILKEFFEVFKEESDKLVTTLKQEAGGALNVIPISSQSTLNTICESAMGVKLSDLGNDGVTYRNNIYIVGQKLLFRMLRPWLIPDEVYSLLGYRKELDVVLKPLHAFTKSIIAQRKVKFNDKKVNDVNNNNEPENVYYRSKKRRFAMMDTLLQQQQDGLIDDDGIMEETDTFTFEGHDTTSAAMIFTLLLLSHHPEAQKKIFNEIQDALATSDIDELSMDDLNRMEYLDRVIKESLRIYPPVPFISRDISEDIQIEDVTIPKGTICNIHIFDVHRDPKYFPDPEKFDPDRFLPENSANRSNFAFIAFSAGMRNCIGQRFAMLELKVILTKIIRNFKILPVTTREEIVFLADLVLRSKFPIKMIFNERDRD